jgi:putative acetyltransferase
MKITVRLFEERDAQAIASLFYETVHTINVKDYSAAQIEAWAPSELDGERWKIALFPTLAYVAESAGQIIGFTDMTRDGFLCHMYTHKNFQGQGVATQLLKTIETRAIQLGLKELRTEASITARPFFEKNGYICLKSQDKPHNGQIFRNFIMQKTFKL